MLFGTTFSKTLDQKLQEAEGKPAGFDYMRLILSLLVILFHAWQVSYGYVPDFGLPGTEIRAPVASILVMFFTLSGFLVAGSLDRSRNVFSFAMLRIIRIMPALAVEVVLCALILGPYFTTLSRQEYFSHHELHAYFWNLVGHVHYYLPRTFADNPLRNLVNAQLWTVPYELVCYCLLLIVALLRIHKNRNILLIVLIAYFMCFYIPTLLGYRGFIINPRYWVVVGQTLIMSFLAGIGFYKFRDVVPWDFNLFFLSTVVALTLLTIPELDMFAVVPAAYATVYLGLFNPPKNKIILSGDYSYGLYLYAYPLQQAFVAIAPAWREWYWNFLAVVPVALIFAVFSWWCIEKPALRLRSLLVKRH